MGRRFFFSLVFLSGVAGLLFFTTTVPAPTGWLPSGRSEDQRSQELARQAIARVKVVPQRIRVVGYDRTRFLQGWAQSVAPDGSYCSTRELVLNLNFPTQPASPCPRATGEAPDEYSAELVRPQGTDIDHIVPLAAAWDLGAHAWSPGKRHRFANDWHYNLAVTASDLNREKSDATLEAWLPPAPAAQCPYVARYLVVAARYGLAITAGDAAVAREACQLPR